MENNKKKKHILSTVYSENQQKIDLVVLVVSLAVIVMSLFHPCLASDIAACVLGLVGLIYLGSALRYFNNRIEFDLLLIQGNFLLKTIIVSVLLMYVLYLMIFCLSFSSCYILTNASIASEAFGGGNFASSIIGMSSERPSLWTIFIHYIDPGNQHIALTQSARGFVGICAMLGVFIFNGLLVSSIIGWIDKRKKLWRTGEIRYGLKNFRNKNFAVVIGANEVVCSVIKNLLSENAPDEINNKNQSNNAYVILQTNRKTEDVRRELSSHLSEDEMRKVIIYFAYRDSEKELRELFVERATEIYVLGESTEKGQGENYHDAMNMRCVNLISEILQDKKNTATGEYKKKVCKVMIDYQSTYSIFQFSDIKRKIDDVLIFIPFNRYESWARKIIVEGFAITDSYTPNSKEISYTPLDGDGISPDSNEHVHLVIVGMSKMGVALAVQALHQCHFLNYSKAELDSDKERKNNLRTRVTFIDTHADKEMNFFKGRYSNLFSFIRHRYIDASVVNTEHLIFDSKTNWKDPIEKVDSEWKHLRDDGSNFIDAEIEFIKGELESDGVRQYLTNLTDGKSKTAGSSKLTIAICLTQTHQAISASLYMPISVYEKVQEIWVYQKENSDIIDNLTETEQKDLRYHKLKPFGMLYGEYMSDRTLYLKGLLVNAAYDVNEEEIDFHNKETYSDLKPTWKSLSIDKKFSNKFFADSIYQKIRGVFVAEDKEQMLSYKSITDFLKNCDQSGLETIIDKIKDNEQVLAVTEHNRWNMQQLLLGYSGCNKEQDEEFKKLNTAVTEDIEAYSKWKKNNNFNSLKPIEKLNLKRTDSDYKKLAVYEFDKYKNECKESSYRRHPNICCYSHLSKVDSGAYSYDKDLNNMGIKYILRYVDGYSNINLMSKKSNR